MGAVLTGMVVQSAVVSALAQATMPDARILGGILSESTAAALVAGGATFFLLLRNHQAVRFTDEVIGELAKVTWPTREEAVQATSTVIVTTVLIAVLLGVYDIVWKNLADLVLFTEG
ncbi:MAG: preprotein translocase subunit SecE [Phycisphaerales bacterium]|nr:preprotein translocase subunit SecE [Phycisphaerales bacterium]